MSDRGSEELEERRRLSGDVKVEARRLGFELAGIAPAVTPTGFSRLTEWLGRGYSGEMSWMGRRVEAYEHPRGVLEGVRSVIVLGMNYRTTEPVPVGATQGRVSRYAWGEVDYHELIRERLRLLGDFVHGRLPECRTRGVVDTAPLLERDFARLAGLGWFGKNTMLINREAGSWLFLSALLVDIELAQDEPHETAHCGTCTRCLEACPTDAFVEAYVLDARRCVSYLTIELRDRAIPIDLREGVGEWLFGCDVCQEVCPWNHRAAESREPSFFPRTDLLRCDAVELLALDDEGFKQRFGTTPPARSGRAGLLRNAAIVLGNGGDAGAVGALCGALNDREPLIRGAAAWALGQLGGEIGQRALQTRRGVEDNVEVLGELETALRNVADRTEG